MTLRPHFAHALFLVLVLAVGSAPIAADSQTDQGTSGKSASPSKPAAALPAVTAAESPTITLSASPVPSGGPGSTMQTTTDQVSSSALGLLPNDLSLWGMFLSADIIVKVVICGLAFASVVTWTIWLVKSLELAVGKRRLRRAYRTLREARSLAVAAELLNASDGVARAMTRTAREEWRASSDALDDRDGLKERIALHLERVEAAIGRRMMVGTGILATIGSTAPFVGLFGTVWGIMNSFIGISRMHTTNLAVVAPGIAEALLATAIGLVAAIPAVIIYNHFARQISAYKALIADTTSAVLRLVSRDLSRGVGSEAGETRNMLIVAE